MRRDPNRKLDSNRRMTWIEEGGIDLRGAREAAAAKVARKKAKRSATAVKAKRKSAVKPKARARPKSKRRAAKRRRRLA